MNIDPRDRLSEQILRRIHAEFMEMPGLRLTRRQAQRLWGLDEGTCARILEFLVDIRFLCRTKPDTYGRMTDGPVTFPQPQRT
jgi:hypothetical protein